MSDQDERRERARMRRIETAKELEGRGFVDHAVREYLKADAPAEAARVLASAGRMADAAKAILDALGVTAETAGSTAPAHYALLRQAAVLLEQSGDAARARAIRDALPASDASPASAPPSADAPPRPSLRAPSAAAPSAGFRPPGAAESAPSSASIRAPSPDSRSVASAPPSSGAPESAAAASVRPSGASASMRVPSPESAAAAPPSAASASVRVTASPESSPARAPSASATFRPPSAQGPASSAHAERSASSAETRASAAATAARVASPPTPVPPPGEGRLSASGDVVTEYSGSREAGWRDAGAASIDESIRQLLASGRKGAAARVAWDAGHHEQALAWFEELGLRYQAGACLRALGRFEEALESLLAVPIDGPHYRKACFELVPVAKALARLDFDIDRFFTRFVEEGPRDRDEVATYLELAELYRAASFARGAVRCVAKILELDASHERARALRAELDAPGGRPRVSSPPPDARGLPPLPTLEEFVRLARANAPRP